MEMDDMFEDDFNPNSNSHNDNISDDEDDDVPNYINRKAPTIQAVTKEDVMVTQQNAEMVEDVGRLVLLCQV